MAGYIVEVEKTWYIVLVTTEYVSVRIPRNASGGAQSEVETFRSDIRAPDQGQVCTNQSYTSISPFIYLKYIRAYIAK